MRNRVLFAIFALFAATACSSSDTDQLIIPEDGNQEVVIPEGNDVFELTTSAIAPEEEVRAGFTDAQKTQTVWYKGDQIRLTSLAGASAVLTNELEQGNNAFFRGTGTAAAEIDTYFAAYPSSLDLRTDGKVVMDFSKVQDGSEQNAIMAAGWCESVGKNEIVMGFTPINALLYVTVANLPAGYTIYEVKFSDLDTLLPGSQTYDISAASYGTMTTEGGLTHYTINTSATNFFIALPAYYTPTTGYVLTVKAKDGAGQEYCTVGAFGAQGGFSAGSTSYVTFDWTKNGISTIGPKTSYDLYLANNSAANTANTGQLVYCDANNATTYTMQNTLINKGFITNVGYVYDGTEFNTGSGIVWDQPNKQFYVGSNLDGQSKAAHSLEVFMTTKLGDRIVVRKTLHVTGIPYTSPDCRSNDVAAAPGWETTGTVEYWENRGWQISYYYNYLFGSESKAGSLFSPTFYTPASVNVTYIPYMAYFTTINGSGSATIYSGVTTGTTEAKTNSTNISILAYSNPPAGDSYTACSHNATIPAGNAYRIYISDNRPTYKDNRAQNWVCMRLFEIKYNI